LARGDPEKPFTPPPSQLFSIGTLALVAQVLILYWCTALLKSGVEWHGQATAVYYALNYDQLATPVGVWLRQFTDLLPWMTRGTIIFETFGPFLLISPFFFGPLRTLGAALFMCMHHTFAMCLILGLFPWIDMASMLMLLPAWFWDRAVAFTWRGQERVTVYFDDGCEVCRKLVLIVTEFLVVQHVRAEAVNTRHRMRAIMDMHNSWLVEDEGGVHHGFAAFVALARVSPLLGPLSNWLGKGFRLRWGERIYRAVADNRPRMAHFTQWLKRGEPVTLDTHPWVGAVCLFLLYMVVAWNLAGLPGTFVGYPNILRPLAYMLRLDQDWGMFAPKPSTEDGWYATPGTLVNGSSVDVYARTFGAVSYDKPAMVSDMYKNQRWSKYMMNIWLARNADYRLYFGQYLCRWWNGNEPMGPERLFTFDITYVREDTLPNGKVGEPTRVVLWQHRCYDTVPPKVNLPEKLPTTPAAPPPAPMPQTPAPVASPNHK